MKHLCQYFVYFACFVSLLCAPMSVSAADSSNCTIVCSMDTAKFPIDNPFPGINVRLSDLYAWTNVENALKALGYSKQNCGEGGCTLVASSPVQCSTVPCKFPNTGGTLVTRINLNWVW